MSTWQKALSEGARLMQENESFAEPEFMDWYQHFCDVLICPVLAEALNVDEMSDEEVYLIIGVLALTGGDTYWKQFQDAWYYGGDMGQMMGRWAMESTDRKRFDYDVGLGNFFIALAQYAQYEFEATGGQLSLF